MDTKDTNETTDTNEEPTYYYYAVRESWTNKQRLLKVLSRRFHTRIEAEFWASFEKSLVRLNRNHNYIVIMM